MFNLKQIIMSKQQTVNIKLGGIGTLIFAVFLFLKLAEIGQVAQWSWWWITSPLWIPVLLIITIPVIIILFAVIVKLIFSIFK